MTYIYTELNADDMLRMLHAVGSEKFSKESIGVYIDYIKDLGEPLEFDPIGFDCQFSEYDLADDDDRESFLNDYGYLVEGQTFIDYDSRVEAIMDKIGQKTLVLSCDYNCFLFDYNF